MYKSIVPIKICTCGEFLRAPDVKELGVQESETFNLYLLECNHCRTTFSLRWPEWEKVQDQFQKSA